MATDLNSGQIIRWFQRYARLKNPQQEDARKIYLRFYLSTHFRRLSTLQDKLANNGGFIWRFNLIIWTRSTSIATHRFIWSHISSRSYFSWRKSNDFVIFLSRISSYNPASLRHASHIRDSFNNESKQMHFLAWTFYWRPNWRPRRRSREIARFSNNRIWDSQETQGDLYIYISHKKYTRNGRRNSCSNRRAKAKNSGDSRRNRDEGASIDDVAGGDRELFLYKRDDNQALVGLIVMLLAKTIIMRARDTRLYDVSVICYCQRRESKRKSEKHRGREAWETEAARALVRSRFDGSAFDVSPAWKNKNVFLFRVIL